MGPTPDYFYEPVANYGYGLSLGDGATLITRWQAPTVAAPLGADNDVPQSASCSCRSYRVGMTSALLAFLGGSVIAALITRE